MIFTSLNIQLIIALFIVSAIIFPIAVYKRRKSPRFRLIERRISEFAYSYTPQVRIDGIWLNINSHDGDAWATNQEPQQVLDPEDALIIIEQFKSVGIYTIHSNRKLHSNEKAIIVE